MSFKRDEDLGQQAVDAILDYLIDQGHTAFELEGKKDQKKGDICILRSDDSEFNIEVKHDVMAARTGNLCFEITNGRKLTGIMATKSDGVYYVVPRGNYKEVFAFNTDKLKKYLHLPGKAEVKNGGDRKKFMLALVCINQIIADEVAESIFRIEDA